MFQISFDSNHLTGMRMDRGFLDFKIRRKIFIKWIRNGKDHQFEPKLSNDGYSLLLQIDRKRFKQKR